MPESKIVIGVAGRIGSGKTEIAHLLETESEFQYLRYSLVLAEWFQTEPSANTLLQQVGWNVMSQDMQHELNERLIQEVDPRRDCVVDGLRHPIDFESLKRAFSSRFFLIYVDAPPHIRFQRLRDRYTTEEDFKRGDSHPVESHIESLRPCASHILDGTLGSEQLASELRFVASQFRSRNA